MKLADEGDIDNETTEKVGGSTSRKLQMVVRNCHGRRLSRRKCEIKREGNKLMIRESSLMSITKDYN